MSHFLTKPNFQTFPLRQRRMGTIVRVSRRDKTLTIQKDQDNVVILGGDAKVSWLSAEYRVLSPEGDKIKASGRFAVTLETLDPLHVVLDIF